MKTKHLFTLLAIFCAFQASSQNNYINEDFNGATTLPIGWTNTAVSGTQTWSFGIDGAAALGNQNINGTEFAFFDDDALGGGSINNTVSLLTPVFDNSGVSVSSLEFDYNLRTFAGIADSFYVDVFDGINWNRVFSIDTSNCGTYIGNGCTSGFPHANINISAFANTNCQVRFTYHDGNDWGWYVGLDNVRIWSSFPFDLGVTSIIKPASSCGLTTADTLEVEITNLGSNPVSNFNIGYSLNGGVINTETVSSSISGGATFKYKFNATANLSSVGTYQLEAFTLLGNDYNNTNDTAIAFITNEPSFSPTYNEDFESAFHLWIVSGTNTSWQRGVPAGANINTAPSGQNAFVTNLTGSHNNHELSYLTSPCFDFSGSIGDPIMTFSLYRMLENGFDLLWMESSIDNGLTWIKIQGAANANNWYNNTSIQTWTGTNNSWFLVENILTGLGSQSQVKLRFAFTSDGSTALEGVGIDNFSLRNPPLFDISLNSLDYPVVASAPECGYGIEFITVELENKGANVLNNFDVAYVVDGAIPVVETITTPLASNTTMSYTFSQPYDFSIIKNYDIDVFATAANDNFQLNDSLINQVLNNTLDTSFRDPFKENFDSWIAGTVFSNSNDTIDSNWTRNSSAIGSYTWRVGVSTVNRTGNTGPFADHTGGNFLYTEASLGVIGDIATLTSPCIKMTNTNGAKLSFWYHRYGSQITSPIYIDIYDGTNWIYGYDQVNGITHLNGIDPFLRKIVDLNPFVGRNIKVQFRAISGGCCVGDMAIDDIMISDFNSRNTALVEMSYLKNCIKDLNVDLSVKILNYSDSIVPADSIFIFYQIDNLPVVADTINQLIEVDSIFNFTFSQKPVFPNQTKIRLKVWTQLNRDKNFLDDTLVEFMSFPDYAFPYQENFDNMDTMNQTKCWDFDPPIVNTTLWNIGNSSDSTAQKSLPFRDHTSNSITGNFAYIHGTSFAFQSVMETPELNIAGTSNAYLGFWHHIKQIGSGVELFVDVLPNRGSLNYITLDTIYGPSQTSNLGPWSPATTDLSAYLGDTIRLRLRATNLFPGAFHIAIDDFSITTSPLVSIKEQVSENQISIYPNPSTGVFYVRSSDKLKEISIQDINGKLILQKRINNRSEFSFDLSDKPAGIYFIQFRTEESVSNQKIVIQ